MFREMRRKEKQLSEEAVNKILKDGKYGNLATINEEGYPYITPLNYVFSNDKIYFHSAVAGEKVDNIKRCPKVSFCIVNDMVILADKFDTNYSSVILFGKASEVFEEEKEAALEALIGKYSKDFIKEGKEYIKKAQKAVRVFAIEIEHITGKFQK